ncbi:hypothetical protein [Paenibacillus apiarius]|uniref:hypothetical protein n=1 Tax=Paenibacillus apiarius TaxID=46240 RepID=UPI0019819813|nr:hypothetical protein [Paenibacillus apiarius]MBN3523167.1 hypothetical protein [Paenibacillus apiarius]
MTKPHEFFGGITVLRNVFFQMPQGSHWLGINRDGVLQHAVHRLQEPPLFMTWQAHGPIRQFCAIPSEHQIHVLAQCDTGLYYLKCSLDTGLQQERCIERSGSAGFPYLFMHRSALYIGYVVKEQEALTFKMKVCHKGVWRERSVTFPDMSPGQTGQRIEQALFTVSEQGRLYGLFHVCSDEEEQHALELLEVDFKHESDEVWMRLFAAAEVRQRWKIGLSVDEDGQPHAAWTILSGTAVASHYANPTRIPGSCMPLSVRFEDAVPQPYFICRREMLLLLLVEEGGRIAITYSTDYGECWSPFTDICFSPQAQLSIVQSIISESDWLIPVLLLGVGAPFFRPIEEIDLLNSFSAMKALLPVDTGLAFYGLQVERLFRHFEGKVDGLQAAVNEMDSGNAAKEMSLQQIMEQCRMLEQMEREVLAEIKKLQEAADAETFSLRFIL